MVGFKELPSRQSNPPVISSEEFSIACFPLRRPLYCQFLDQSLNQDHHGTKQELLNMFYLNSQHGVRLAVSGGPSQIE